MENSLRKFKIFKSGFTLAEVLITLVIVGIIAAMTIPAGYENVTTCSKTQAGYDCAARVLRENAINY